MGKKFLFLIVLSYLINVNNFAISEIIPLKKPVQTKEETQKKLMVDVLKPLPKPSQPKETKKIKEKKIVKKEKKKFTLNTFTKEKAFYSWK